MCSTAVPLPVIRPVLVTMLAVCCVVLPRTAIHAQTGLWQLVNPLPVAEDLHAAAFGEDRYVAVGEAGTVLLSPDGLTWSRVESTTDETLFDVVWAGGQFVAVGSAGAVLLSPDGEEWSLRQAPTDLDLRGVAEGSEGLLAVGEAGGIFSSSDGRSWTAVSSGVEETLRAAAWTGAMWIVVGNDGVYLYSDDCHSWTLGDPRPFGTDLIAVASHGSTAVVLSEEWVIKVDLEQDPPFWEAVSHPWSTHHTDIVWCGERWVIAGGDGVQQVFEEPWDLRVSQKTMVRQRLSGLACGLNGTVGVGPGGQVGWAEDGDRWRKASSFEELDIRDMLVHEGRIVGVAGRSADLDELKMWFSEAVVGEILNSSDGTNWNSNPRRFAEMNRLVAGPDRLLAVGNSLFCTWPGGCYWTPGAWSSTNGVNWTSVGWGGGRAAICWDGQRYLSVAYHRIGYTEDGAGFDDDAWEWDEIGPDADLRCVASDGEVVVTAGADGRIWNGTPGGMWTESVSGVTSDLHEAAWGDGLFVVVGDGGTVLTSSDGTTWARPEVPTTTVLRDVEWTGERFLVAGDAGVVLSSADGVAWTAYETGLKGRLLAVAESVNGLIVAGSDGVVARELAEDPGAPPEARFSWRPQPLEEGLPAQFFDLSTNQPTEWSWSFGDGGTSAEENPSHAYSGTGVFPLELETRNAHGVGQAVVDVEVQARCGPPPPPTVTAPESVASGEPFEVEWSHESDCSFLVYGRRGDQLSELKTSGGTRTYSVHWWESESFEITAVATCQCPDGEWDSESSEPVIVEVMPTAYDPGPIFQVVPAVAHAAGAGGARWRSELTLHNPGPRPARVALILLDGEPELGAFHQVTIASGESHRIDDVVPMVTNAAGDVGGLLVASTERVLAAVRVLNLTDAGEMGEHLPGITLGAASNLRVLNIADPNARTNLGLANPHAHEIAASVEVFDGQGTTVGSSQVSVPAHGLLQLNDIFGSTGSVGLENAWGVVDTGDEGVVGYASVVDCSSGDASTQTVPRWATEWTLSPTISIPWDFFASGSIAMSEDRFVVSVRGGLASTEDGSHWDRVFITGDLSDVECHGGQCIAVGEESVASSDDGVTWTEAPWTGPQLNALATDGDLWVAVGDSGMAVWSVDGLSWTIVDLGDGANYRDVTWTGERFVAVSKNRSRVALSSDGKQWTTHAAGNYHFQSIAAGNGVLVATANNLYENLYWSEDGLEWHLAEGSGYHNQVVWAGDRFVAAHRDTPPEGWMSTSIDGRTWEPVDPFILTGDEMEYPFDMAWDGSKIAVLAEVWRTGPKVISWLNHHESTLTLPGLARINGLNDSLWVSAMQMVNHSETDGEVSVELYQNGQGNPNPLVATRWVEAGHARVFDNVVGSFFGQYGSGAFRLDADFDLSAAARTFDEHRLEVRGQHIPALSDADAVWFLEEGRLIGLDHGAAGSDRRTNIGLLSRCAEPMSVDVRLSEASGEALGTLELELQPFEFRQLNGVLETLTSEPVENAYSVVTTDHRRCSFFTWASVVDNGTGDALWIPSIRRVPLPER